MVFKCLDQQNGDTVAVKRFTATDDDPLVKKIALREIKMLKVYFFKFKQIFSILLAFYTLQPLNLADKSKLVTTSSLSM